MNTVGSLDWPGIGQDIESYGCGIIGSLLSVDACAELARGYDDEDLFRSRVVMSRHGFGRGEYKYFGNSIPEIVAGLRHTLFPPLAQIANGWNAALGIEARFPPEHGTYIAECHQAGQTKPTPLLLKYGPGDYNCLHQDVYGDLIFPLQVAVLLSQPGRDFTGGEFVLTEQRPRMQSRVEVAPLQQGDAVIFPVRQRPVRGTKSIYRTNLRHGVSRVRTGQRFTLGIIFHDAA